MPMSFPCRVSPPSLCVVLSLFIISWALPQSVEAKTKKSPLTAAHKALGLTAKAVIKRLPLSKNRTLLLGHELIKEGDDDEKTYQWLIRHFRLGVVEKDKTLWVSKGIPTPQHRSLESTEDNEHPMRLCVEGTFEFASLAFLKNTKNRFIKLDLGCSRGEDAHTGQRYSFIMGTQNATKLSHWKTSWHGVTNLSETEFEKCTESWFLTFRAKTKGAALQSRRTEGCKKSRLKRGRWKTIIKSTP